jgi:hypothetical protein
LSRLYGCALSRLLHQGGMTGVSDPFEDRLLRIAVATSVKPAAGRLLGCRPAACYPEWRERRGTKHRGLSALIRFSQFQEIA